METVSNYKSLDYWESEDQSNNDFVEELCEDFDEFLGKLQGEYGRAHHPR